MVQKGPEKTTDRELEEKDHRKEPTVAHCSGLVRHRETEDEKQQHAAESHSKTHELKQGWGFEKFPVLLFVAVFKSRHKSSE